MHNKLFFTKGIPVKCSEGPQGVTPVKCLLFVMCPPSSPLIRHVFIIPMHLVRVVQEDYEVVIPLPLELF